MKTLLAALAAVMLIGAVATATPAQANCWWNGYTWRCWSPAYHPYWRHHHPYWRHPRRHW
ncbi:MAG TPA: hypothetical protein VKQ73_07670 [Stellaceae bacterium]|nr:hypothetical protein [Stellaceae bacterium]